MTTQAAEELDIFKTGAQSGKPVEAPKAEEQQSKTTSPANAIQGDRKKRIVNFVNRIEAWHFLVLAVVLAVLFVMVPKLFPKHQTSAQQQPTPVQQDAVNNVLTAPEPEPQEAVVPAASPEQSALSAEQLKGLNEQVGSLSGVVVGLQNHQRIGGKGRSSRIGQSGCGQESCPFARCTPSSSGESTIGNGWLHPEYRLFRPSLDSARRKNFRSPGG